MPVRKLYRVRPRGFCAGVARAIEIVDLALQSCGLPVYVLHEIVHNRHVIEDLALRGAVFVEDIEQVPDGAWMILSAHGVSPLVRATAGARNMRLIDATCPLVTKVHLEAIRFAREGCTILLIGHRDHAEIRGTAGEAPGLTRVISTPAEAERVRVPDLSRVVYLTQTTLSQYDTAEIVAILRRRFPAIQGPPTDDICYATQNRQEAVDAVARRAEVMLVVGSCNSANSNRLVEVAQRAGARAHLIEDENAIDSQWLESVASVAVTAGASAPEVVVDRVTRRLQEIGFTAIEEVELAREDVHFKLPPELVTLGKAVPAPPCAGGPSQSPTTALAGPGW